MAWNGVERSLIDWGIDMESFSLTLRGWQADEFAFAMDAQNAFAPQTFANGDDIALYKDSVAIFIGKIARRQVFGGTAERQKYVAVNFWYDLERLIFEQLRNVVAEDFTTIGIVATTQVVFGRNTATGTKIDTEDQLKDLADFAHSNGVAMARDIDFEGLIAPWEQANDVSVASGLRRVAAWQPDLLGRAEYESGTATLRMRRPSDDDVLKIVDLTAGDSVLSIQADRRDDMAPRGVVFNFITTEVNPLTGARYIRVTQQFGGPHVNGPGVIKVTMPIGDAETIPPNLAPDYFAAISKVFLEGQLVLKGREISTEIRPGDLISFLNGQDDWEGTFAPVTEVSHALNSGVTTINFGPPTFLSAASFAALASKAKDKSNPPVPPSDPGNGGTGNADTGKGGYGGPSGGGSVGITHCVDGEQVTDSVARG